MKKFNVKIRIFNAYEECVNATFEICAKDELCAKFRVMNLFDNRIIKDGDYFEIVEVIEVVS